VVAMSAQSKPPEKNPHAVELGRAGGRKGGGKWQSKLSKAELSRRMRELVLKRWAVRREKDKG